MRSLATFFSRPWTIAAVLILSMLSPPATARQHHSRAGVQKQARPRLWNNSNLLARSLKAALPTVRRLRDRFPGLDERFRSYQATARDIKWSKRAANGMRNFCVGVLGLHLLEGATGIPFLSLLGPFAPATVAGPGGIVGGVALAAGLHMVGRWYKKKHDTMKYAAPGEVLVVARKNRDVSHLVEPEAKPFLREWLRVSKTPGVVKDLGIERRYRSAAIEARESMLRRVSQEIGD
jgi:hypothetical protein